MCFQASIPRKRASAGVRAFALGFAVRVDAGHTHTGLPVVQNTQAAAFPVNGGKNLYYSIWPSFAMPYATALTKNVEHGLRLRKWNVPYEVLADIFGRDPMFWYRLETSFGRYNIVATTVKTTERDLMKREPRLISRNIRTFVFFAIFRVEAIKP